MKCLDHSWASSFRTSTKIEVVVVLATALLATIWGFQRAPLLLQSCKPVNYVAPEESVSRKAEKLVGESFPLFQKAAGAQILLILRAVGDTPSVFSPAIANFSQYLRMLCLTDETLKQWRPILIGYYIGVPLVGIEPEDDIVARGFVSADNRTTLLDFIITKVPHLADGNGTEKFERDMQRRVMLLDKLHEVMAHVPPGYEILVTGNPVVLEEQLHDRSIELLLRGEMIVMPFALLVFIYLVQDVRLLMLIPIPLFVTLLVAASLVNELAQHFPVNPDVPPAMGSVTLALSLDYSLFMLSRFNENGQMRLDLQSNVDILRSHTAHTIAVSGTLIAIAFAGAMSLPEPNLQYAGLSLSITTLVCVIVHVYMLPALIAVLSPFVTGPSLTSRLSVMIGIASQRFPMSSDDEAVSHAPTEKTEEVFKRSMNPWYRLMRCIDRCPWVSVGLVFLLFLPLLAFLPRLRTTADLYAAMPQGMKSVEAVRIMSHDFPVGRFDPYGILVTDHTQALGNNRSSFLNPGGYDVLLDLCDTLRDVDGIASLLGPTYLIHDRVDWARHLELLSADTPLKNRRIYADVLNTHLKKEHALIQVHVDFLPRGANAARWVSSVRQVLATWDQRHSGFSATLTGGASLGLDTQDAVMEGMAVYLCISVFCIMTIVFLMFKSVLLPLRLAFALLFTLAATFSVAVIVYQTPLLHRFFPWLADFDGVSYQAVPIATCVAVALGLDYDIFLITRIVEYRLEGLSDRVSIAKGVARTGGIISGAGLVMSLAFSGLFFSNKLLHQQFALLLVTSVLLDTFVVRTVLVPALMLSAQGMNWWPRRMPDPEEGSSGTEIPEDEPVPEEPHSPRSVREGPYLQMATDPF